MLSMVVIKWQMKSVCQTLHLLGISLSIPFSRLLMKLTKTNSWRTQWLIPSEKCTLNAALCSFSSNKLSVQESTIAVQFLNSFWCKTLSKSFWKSKSLLVDWSLFNHMIPTPWQASGAEALQKPCWLFPNRLYIHVLSDLNFFIVDSSTIFPVMENRLISL